MKYIKLTGALSDKEVYININKIQYISIQVTPNNREWTILRMDNTTTIMVYEPINEVLTLLEIKESK